MKLSNLWMPFALTVGSVRAVNFKWKKLTRSLILFFFSMVLILNANAQVITSAAYNVSTGVLAVTGTGFVANPGGADIDVSRLTITGEGAATYTLTTAGVEITSAVLLSVTLNATDRAVVNLIMNKNGTSSTGGTTYNLEAAANWDTMVAGAADLTNVITVSNVAVPTITSATYYPATGNLVVTGTGFLTKAGTDNDIDVSKLSMTGDGGVTYALTSSGVEISSATMFTVALNSADKLAINALANKNGTQSLDGTVYNLSAAEDWTAGADPSVVVADLGPNAINVSDVTISTIYILGVTPPAFGATPVSVVTPGDGYTGTVSWYPADATFDYGTSFYIATITLTPKAGYTLTGITANQFIIIGGRNVSNAANSGVITAFFNPISVSAVLTSSDADNEICAGDAVTFTGNLAGAVTYEFFVDSVSAGAASNKATYTTDSLKNGQVVTVKATVASGVSGTSAGIATTVKAVPSVTPITGTPAVCAGSTTLFANATSGGLWSSDSPAIAGVNATGLVSGLVPGTSVINYSVTSVDNGCVGKASKTVTVNALPVISAITGTPVVCVGSTTKLASTPAGGIWSSGSPAKAIVDATSGVVTGKEAGTSLVTYTVTVNGCSASVTQTVTVNPLPTIQTVLTAARCDAGTVSLGATASAGTINWYAAASGGTALGTGISFTTPVIAASTQYFVDATNSGCVSTPRKPVMATVNTTPNAPVAGQIIQPSCSTPTATVLLTGLPVTGTCILTKSPGGTTITTNGSAFILNNLISGTYTFKVTSAEGCTSISSANIVINPQPTVPAAPVSKEATNVVQSGFTANWTLSNTATGYSLDVATDNGFTNFVPGYSGIEAGNSTSFIVTGLNADTFYYYRLRARNACGTGSLSNTIIVKTPVEVPPPPAVLSATNVLQTNFSANWAASVRATGYRLDIATDAGFNSFVPGYNDKDVSNVTSQIIAGLGANTTYYYRVRAYNDGGASTTSSLIVVTTLPEVPVVPAALQATNILQTGFSANWSASATATGYRLDVATDIGFSSFLTGYNNKDVGNVTSSGVIGLNARVSYYYRVRAYNTGGTSGNSNAVTAKTLSVPPAAPTGLEATSCNNQVSVKWNVSSDPYVMRYRIYGGLITNPTTKLDSTNAIIAETTKTISGLTNGLTYYFRVTAVNDDGTESLFSNQASVIVKTGLIPKITLKWNEVLICSNTGDSVKSYQWYLGSSLIAGASAQYISTNKIPGIYKVVTVDKAGCQNSSGTIMVVSSNSLTTYPNPAIVSFTLKLKGAINGRAVIDMFNASGVKVFELQAENVNEELIREVAVSNLEDGVYFVQVMVNQQELYNTKMIVKK